MSTLAAPAAGRDRLGPFRRGDFRLFWFGEATSVLGTSIGSIAVPLVAVTVLHAGTFAVAALTAATWLPWLLIGLPAGAWVDRLPPRAVLITADLTSLVAFGSVPVAAWLGVLSLGHLAAAALVAGTAGVFFQTAYQVFLTRLLPAAERPAGNAALVGTESALQVAGPGLGGLLAQAFGAVTGLLADALSFAVSAVCLARVRPAGGTPRPRPGREPLRAQIATGLRFVARDGLLRVFAVQGAVSNLALTGYQAILVVFLVRSVGLAPGEVGAVLAAMSVGGVLGAALAGPLGRRLGTGRAVLVTALAGPPGALLVPLTAPGPGLAFAAAGGVAVGVGVSVGNILRASFRQTYVPAGLLGRVLTSMQVLNLGAIPVGALLGGALGSTLGVRPAMWIMTVLVAGAGLVLLAGPLRHQRDLPGCPA